MANIQITTAGIKKSLNKYKPLTSIAEYVWNGFDAGASIVKIELLNNQLGTLEDIVISDNGSGIIKSDLNVKFKPFFESEKIVQPDRKKHSDLHGKNGVGRLTFFTFCNDAEWKTVYEKDNKKYRYSICVNTNTLEEFNDSDEYETIEEVGTSVTFKNVFLGEDSKKIEDFIALEFGWFLELNAGKGFKISINNKTLDYGKYIEDSELRKYTYKNIDFEVKFVQWNRKLSREYSRYYFIDSNEKEVFKETTSLNNKSDKFYHSVYVKSTIFDDFNYYAPINQVVDSGFTKGSEEFVFIMNEIVDMLRNKRRPFLKKYSDKLVDEFEENGVFPVYNESNVFDKFKKDTLENTVREIYQIQPKIFTGLRIEQKKTLVRFLDLIMQTGEVDDLLKILDDIIELESSERKDLAEILQVTKMSNVIKTLKLIKDRNKAIEELKLLVFKKELGANEVRHIQGFIEKHYWIFGEQYNLVTAAEPKFEEALRRYTYYLTGKDEKRKIDHPDRLKEMDIFAVRQNINCNGYDNIVIELKHPNIRLGEKELNQVKKYMDVILEQPEFNAVNFKWEFYLVGNKFSGKYIEREIKNAKSHGEQSLVYKVDNYKIFVKSWSDIFAEFEMKHKYLNEKLELERDKLVNGGVTADDITDDNLNVAMQPAELVI